MRQTNFRFKCKKLHDYGILSQGEYKVTLDRSVFGITVLSFFWFQSVCGQKQ